MTVKRISVAGPSRPIRLDRHIGQARENGTDEVKHHERNVASDDKAVPEQLAAPAE